MQITSDRKIISQSSQPATEEEASELLPKLELVLAAYPRGIGLSAIQVGVPRRVFVMRTSDGFMRFHNPAMLDMSVDRDEGTEMCLSLPGYRRRVRRARWILVQPRPGAEAVRLEGLQARIVQHELDHLAGRCLMDVGRPVHGGG